MSTISENLEILKTQIGLMKSNLGIAENAPLTTLTEKTVEVTELGEKTITENGTYNASDDNLYGYSKVTVNMEAPASNRNAYAVKTIAERNKLTDVNVGDLCIVINKGARRSIQPTDKASFFIFPATVVLPSAVTGELACLLDDPYNPYYSELGIMASVTPTEAMFNSMSGSMVHYTSTDGITYTRSSEAYIASKTPLAPDNWKDFLSYFIQVEDVTFNGIYEKTKTGWTNANIGTSTGPLSIALGEKAYVTGGLITGKLGTNVDDYYNSRGSFIRLNSLLKNTTFDIGNHSTDGGYFNKFEVINGTIPIVKVMDTPNGNISGAFRNCTNVEELDLSNFKTSDCTGISSLFLNCSSLKKVNVSNFYTSNVTGMETIFYGCSNLGKVNLLNFDTSKVTSMMSMFKGCSSLTELDLSNFDTSKVTNMASMFYNCTSLKKLDIRNFVMNQITNSNYYKDMFTGVPSDCLIIVKNSTQKSWITSKFSSLKNVQLVSSFVNISLQGNAVMTLSSGATYSEPGYTATDKSGNDITNYVVVDKSELDTSKAGYYNIYYSVAANGEVAHAVRHIKVTA